MTESEAQITPTLETVEKDDSSLKKERKRKKDKKARKTGKSGSARLDDTSPGGAIVEEMSPQGVTQISMDPRVGSSGAGGARGLGASFILPDIDDHSDEGTAARSTTTGSTISRMSAAFVQFAPSIPFPDEDATLESVGFQRVAAQNKPDLVECVAADNIYLAPQAREPAPVPSNITNEGVAPLSRRQGSRVRQSGGSSASPAEVPENISTRDTKSGFDGTLSQEELMNDPRLQRMLADPRLQQMLAEQQSQQQMQYDEDGDEDGDAEEDMQYGSPVHRTSSVTSQASEAQDTQSMASRTGSTGSAGRRKFKLNYGRPSAAAAGASAATAAGEIDDSDRHSDTSSLNASVTSQRRGKFKIGSIIPNHVQADYNFEGASESADGSSESSSAHGNADDTISRLIGETGKPPVKDKKKKRRFKIGNLMKNHVQADFDLEEELGITVNESGHSLHSILDNEDEVAAQMMESRSVPVGLRGQQVTQYTIEEEDYDLADFAHDLSEGRRFGSRLGLERSGSEKGLRGGGGGDWGLGGNKKKQQGVGRLFGGRKNRSRGDDSGEPDEPGDPLELRQMNPHDEERAGEGVDIWEHPSGSMISPNSGMVRGGGRGSP